METTTIVVLSVLSTLVIIGLIAMANGLRKAHKQIKDLEINLETTKHQLETVHKDAFALIDDRSKETEEYILATQNHVDRVEESIHRRIDDTLQKADEQYANISRHTEETWKEWTSDLDRRFDRLYQMIYEAFPQLKK
jgi:predicted  nucleic acid-binding Zn-ribbon protein